MSLGILIACFVILAAIFFFVFADSGKSSGSSVSLSKEEKQRLRGLAVSSMEAFLSDPLQYRDRDFAGVYVLRNASRNKYCIGSSARVYHAVADQLTGEGNARLYEDKVMGDRFDLHVISLDESGYKDLAALRVSVWQCYEGKRYT